MNSNAPDITDIPDGINITSTLVQNISDSNSNTMQQTAEPASINSKMTCPMIIDILNDTILNSETSNCNHPDNISVQSNSNLKNLSFQSIIEKYTLDFKQSVAFEIIASSFILKSLSIEGISIEDIHNFFEENEENKIKYTNCLSGLKKTMKDRGGEDELVMFLSGMGGTGKSEVIKAFIHFAQGISIAFGWNYDNNVIKVTALTGSAACEIPNGKTLHSQAGLTSRKIPLKLKETWNTTKMIIIDEVSFLDEENIRKLDKNMRKLKESDSMYGGIHVVFVGDFFQMLPVRGSPLFKANTLQFNAINRAVFLNVSHRFENDPEYGDIMRRFRLGKVLKEDIHKINTRHFQNSDIVFPPITKLRCACYMNDERNAYNNVVFLQHLKATHQEASENCTNIPTHTCIIKCNMKYSNKQNGTFNKNMYNRLLDECGDSDITNGTGAFVDPSIKFFYNVPLMMNTNARIDENLANGTPCKGLYIKLKKGCKFVPENWEGYMVNTIYANQVEHIVCMQEGNKGNYFIVKPETRQCKIKLRKYRDVVIDGVKVTYLPINSNISTTGHKLQGRTLNHLIVNSWAYKCPHWVYVVLSRVRTLKSLILNEKLDIHRTYEAREELVKWEKQMKDNIETNTFSIRGHNDLEKYLNEELKYKV